MTSTGLTMVERESELPAIVQWWRTLLEWVGGVGIVVLGLALLSPAHDEQALYEAGARQRMLGSDIRSTARRIWGIFAGLTVASIALYTAAGMAWWEAVNHGMTAIATGGFTATDDSFAGYPPQIRAVALVVMSVGALSFAALHVLLVQRRPGAFLRRGEVRAFGAAVLLGAALVVVVVAGAPFDPGPLDAAFQWVSALATCGFSAGELQGWTPAPLLLLVAAMLVGGASGSTAGGYKMTRAVALTRALRARLLGVWYTDEGPDEAHGWRVPPEDVQKVQRQVIAAASMGVLWLATLATGTLVLLLVLDPGQRLSHVLFDATSALGSVGLSTGVAGPSAGWAAKLTFILLMWMGRLEILSVLVLIGAPLRAVLGSGRRSGNHPPGV